MTWGAEVIHGAKAWMLQADVSSEVGMCPVKGDWINVAKRWLSCFLL